MSLARPVVDYDPRFPETDEVPLESDWHRDEMNLLVELGWNRFRGQDDFYVGGNLCIYYDPQDPRKVVGPDFFYVRGVPSTPRRRIWAAWLEGRFPDTIIELLSPNTKHKDRKTNKDIYERTFRTPEYFLYDPQTETLDGWRLVEGRYTPLEPNEDGWLWSEELGLWVGFWEGDIGRGPAALWIRFYDRDGRLVPTQAESERQRAEQEQRRTHRERRRAQQEHQRAEQEHRRAEEERRRAEEERQRAELEHQRAETAEAEIARLKSLLKNGSSRSDNVE